MNNDGEVELSKQTLQASNNVQASVSDLFLDEFLKSAQTCIHTHTCNSPGPDFSHSHTCFHTHSHFIPPETENTDCYDSLHEKRNQELRVKRVPGNREAVRKYREKKKAQTVYLEEEVKKLRFLNTQLVKKVHKQAILEREVLRLISVLVTLKGKIDDEWGDFPFLKQSGFADDFKQNGCAVQSSCGFNPLANSSVQTRGMMRNGSEQMLGALERNCQSPGIDCQAKANGPPIVDRHKNHV
ncbi:basic leucine zipper transcription factor [Lithospermum erythrorhizon]|uniref:Basic leucine zipper transcription factor n=1 Tax=Lithospermum erythrorhizon TaxID=34254 RepID=A0AAV3NYJ5_LITER